MTGKTLRNWDFALQNLLPSLHSNNLVMTTKGKVQYFGISLKDLYNAAWFSY